MIHIDEVGNAHKMQRNVQFAHESLSTVMIHFTSHV